MHHEDCGPPRDSNRANFIRVQRDEEITKGHYLSLIGKEMLPGMYCTPIHAVPKSDTPGDYWLVNDQSAGNYSLNSMVDNNQIQGFPLDNMWHVGKLLLDAWNDKPDKELVMWKCDISGAYRLLPMHPCWQIKQGVRVDDEFFLDRRNAFGRMGTGSLFIAFNSLVAWIVKHILLLKAIRTYVDDSFGANKRGDMTFYKPYDKYMPTSQAKLLELWDYLGIPHKEKKQVLGTPLTIIGISVDPNAMTLSLPKDARQRLVREL